jgi:hypothetical protein
MWKKAIKHLRNRSTIAGKFVVTDLKLENVVVRKKPTQSDGEYDREYVLGIIDSGSVQVLVPNQNEVITTFFGFFKQRVDDTDEARMSLDDRQLQLMLQMFFAAIVSTCAKFLMDSKQDYVFKHQKPKYSITMPKGTWRMFIDHVQSYILQKDTLKTYPERTLMMLRGAILLIEMDRKRWTESLTFDLNDRLDADIKVLNNAVTVLEEHFPDIDDRVKKLLSFADRTQ